jgi:hypothetical protein
LAHFNNVEKSHDHCNEVHIETGMKSRTDTVNISWRRRVKAVIVENMKNMYESCRRCRLLREYASTHVKSFLCLSYHPDKLEQSRRSQNRRYWRHNTHRATLMTGLFSEVTTEVTHASTCKSGTQKKQISKTENQKQEQPLISAGSVIDNILFPPLVSISHMHPSLCAILRLHLHLSGGSTTAAAPTHLVPDPDIMSRPSRESRPS